MADEHALGLGFHYNKQDGKQYYECRMRVAGRIKISPESEVRSPERE